MSRYRNLAELTKHLSPDVADANATLLQRPHQPTTASGVMQRHILEDRFLAVWTTLGGPALQREVRFHPRRRWRLDFALPVVKFGIEVQGGLYRAESGHRSHAGVLRDAEKLTWATILDWRVVFVTSRTIDDFDLMSQIIAYARRLGCSR